MPRNLAVSLEGEIMILTVNAYGRPADKEKMPVPYHFFTARAMNHCCEISFFWVLSVMDYRPLISEAGLKAAPSLVSLLRAAHRGFLSFFFLKAERDSSPARPVTSSGLITSSQPLPCDCQSVWRPFTLAEAWPKDTTRRDWSLGYANISQRPLMIW